ncbi:GGDEF domain-containing protein [Lysobacter sp. N42]|uniref:GGDEF domain-containing protein n=1 Tax=Lysobacter sp. N42 TaxID=2545719 RepID=UPI001053C7DC|nr:GGDEF domain-containing protein [Lysobacter sp. N42]TCZ78013.1 GGDEF domain-containing protein [Lysobacter sp. N42]
MRLLTRAWLWLAVLLCASFPVAAGESTLEVARLDARDVPAAAVLSGAYDAAFVENPSGPVIFQTDDHAVWWRVRAKQPVPAGGRPHLVLLSPFLTEVEVWAPGGQPGSPHALYGDDADDRYATRALVSPLPRGLRVGEAVYVRVRMPGAVPVVVTVEPLDTVHRRDLEYTAWRIAILSILGVLVVLTLAYWAGIGDRSFLYLAATLGFSGIFIAAMGGELRSVPGLGTLFGSNAQPVRAAGALGVFFSGLFVRSYLDLRRCAPRHDRILGVLTWLAAALAAVVVLSPARIIPTLGNFLIVLIALAVLSSAVTGALGGNRAARFLLVSWLPIIVASVLRAAQILGAAQELSYLDHMLAASFALAGVLLTIGLSDTLLELRRDRDEASRRATFDALTGAYTRHAIDARLAQASAAAEADGRPLCVAFVDIDHFKRINDTHGHNVGDQCLRYVSLRIRNVLRGSDVLARYGGDELLVLMPDTTLSEAGRIAERMREAVACRPLALDDLRLPSTLSIGVAEYVPGEGVERLLERADGALYRSKSAGRNRVSAQESLEATGEAT